jgi:hypothetical protein
MQDKYYFIVFRQMLRVLLAVNEVSLKSLHSNYLLIYYPEHWNELQPAEKVNTLTCRSPKIILCSKT